MKTPTFDRSTRAGSATPMSFSSSVSQIACAQVAGCALLVVPTSAHSEVGLSRRGTVPMLKKHETLVNGSLLALPLFNVKSVIYSI